MKSFSFLMCFVLITASLFAQDKGRFSIVAGGNLSGINITNPQQAGLDFEDGLSARPGFQLGVLVTPVVFSEQLSLNAGLLYTQKGFHFSQEWPGAFRTSKGKVRYNYLALPLALRFHTTQALFLEGGIELAYLTGQSTDWDSQLLDIHLVEFKDWDFGIMAGLGYQLLPHLSFVLRYTHSLANNYLEGGFTDQNGEPLLPGDQSWQNYNLQLGAVLDIAAW